MKKIKVAHFITSLNPGGAEIMLKNLCSTIKSSDSRFEFHIISMRNSMSLKTQFEALGIQVSTIDCDHKKFLDKIIYGTKLIHKIKPDIIHTHTLMADQWGMIISFFSRHNKRLSTAHNTGTKFDFYSFIVRRLVNLLSHSVVIVSESARPFYIKYKMYSAKKMKLIPNAPGFNSENKTPKNLPNDGLIRLIQLARYDSTKGQSFLIDACSLLDPKKFTLEVYGEDTGCLDELKIQLNQKNTSHIFLHPPTNEVKLTLESKHIFIASSISESFHMALLEAMSVGLVPILTDIPAHRAFLKDLPQYPYFVPAQNSLAIFNAIKLLSENTSEYHFYSQKMIEISKKYSIESMSEKYHSLYLQIMQE